MSFWYQRSVRINTELNGFLNSTIKPEWPEYVEKNNKTIQIDNKYPNLKPWNVAYSCCNDSGQQETEKWKIFMGDKYQISSTGMWKYLSGFWMSARLLTPNLLCKEKEREGIQNNCQQVRKPSFHQWSQMKHFRRWILSCLQ